MAAAFSAIFLLMSVSEKYLNFKIPIITTLGQNTLGIFLFHGFVIQLLRYKPFMSIDNMFPLSCCFAVYCWFSAVLFLTSWSISYCAAAGFAKNCPCERFQIN